MKPYVESVNGVKKMVVIVSIINGRKPLQAMKTKRFAHWWVTEKKWEESICTLCGRDKWSTKRWWSLCRS